MNATSAGRPVVLVIGGSDPIAAAGIQADLRHLAALGVHGAAVPTALTVQRLGAVTSIEPIAPPLVRAMFDAVGETFEPAAVVVSMLATEPIAREVLLWLHRFHGPVVLDPVMRASAGTALLDDAGIDVLRDFFLPRADVTLPNVAELARLAGRPEPTDEAGRLTLVLELIERGAPAVWSKGGHAGTGDPVDLLHDGNTVHRFVGQRRAGTFRGTGGALAAACAALLARGHDLVSAANLAHAALQLALGRAEAAQTPFLHFAAGDVPA